jgi:predicted site-specific integrase-resolvase
MSNNNTVSEFVDRNEAKSLLGRSSRTISRWVKNGLLSVPEKQGIKFVWKRTEIEAAISRLGLARKEAAPPSAPALAQGGAL